MRSLVVSVILWVCVSYVSSRQVPPYIRKCSVSKNFDDCFVKHANLAIPELLNGDISNKVPSFNPLHLNKVIFAPSDALTIIFTNANVTGFNEAKVTSAKYDDSKKQITFILNVPNLVADTEYNAKGKILILPIEGEGPSKITLVNANFIIKLVLGNFNVESNEKLKVTKLEVDYTVDKTIYHFENLFNGNKELGDEINRFFNDNQADLHKDFSPVFTNIVEEVVRNMVHQLFGRHSFKDVLLV